MAVSRGKQFEAKFKKDWKKAFPNSFFYRLPDQMSGYKDYSKNPCDFICYIKPTLFMIETKSHKGNTFPFSALAQYDRMIEHADVSGVKCYVIIWFIDHDLILAANIKDVTRMKNDGLKSINVKMIKSDNKYNLINIPSTKKRVLLDSDYTVLFEA